MSICRLAKQADVAIDGHLTGVGSETTVADGSPPSDTWVSVTASVDNVVKGQGVGGTLTAQIMSAQLSAMPVGPSSPNVVLFLLRDGTGALRVHPAGGAFFDNGGMFANCTWYAGGVPKSVLLDALGNSTPSVECPDEVGTADRIKPWDGGMTGAEFNSFSMPNGAPAQSVP
jgi:hypothetical protein